MRNVTVFTLIAMLSACDPSQIQTAVAGIDSPCDAAKALAKPVSDAMLDNDWRFFAPMWWDIADPEADETYCRTLAEGLGAVILTGPIDATVSDALVLLPEDFDRMHPVDRAALMCSKATHVVRQYRVGDKSVVETMATAGMAQAVYDAVLERHGAEVPAIRHATKCIDSYFEDLRSQLREVGGV